MRDENLDLFVGGVFGEIAHLNGMPVWGIFDENYDPMFDSVGLGQEGKNITFLVKTSDVTSARHGWSLNCKNRFFEVVTIRPIDDGKLTTLVLKEK